MMPGTFEPTSWCIKVTDDLSMVVVELSQNEPVAAFEVGTGFVLQIDDAARPVSVSVNRINDLRKRG